MSRRHLAPIAAGAALGAAVWALLERRRPRDPFPGRLEYEGPLRDDVGEAGGGLPEDAIVLARIETELFRDREIPKGDIVIEVVGGVATLRGQVEPQLVEDLPVLVSAVQGVVRVENLLHPPGTPAPDGGAAGPS